MVMKVRQRFIQILAELPAAAHVDTESFYLSYKLKSYRLYLEPMISSSQVDMASCLGWLERGDKRVGVGGGDKGRRTA